MPEADWCSFSTCSSRKSGKLKFFPFPVHRPDLCHKWLQNSQNDGLRNLSLSALQQRSVCELHFKKTDFNTAKGRKNLSKDAVPKEVAYQRNNSVPVWPRGSGDFPRLTSGNEMESLDSSCFVCDKTISSDDWKYKLKTTATKKRKVPVSDLIQLLVGDEFEVLVGESDALCSDCMRELNLMDALTDQLDSVKDRISRMLNVKYNLTSDEPEVEFDNSKDQDTETLLSCEKCDFQTELEKELNRHMKTHVKVGKTSSRPVRSYNTFSKYNDTEYELTPAKQKTSSTPVLPEATKKTASKTDDSFEKSKSKITSKKKKSTKALPSKIPQNTSLTKKNKISEIAHKKKSPAGAKKKVKFVFQCSVCNLFCKSKTGMSQHAKRVHGNSKIVVTDSEEEYEDVVTLDDELSNIEKDNTIQSPVKHKLDFLDDWDEEDDDVSLQKAKIGRSDSLISKENKESSVHTKQVKAILNNGEINKEDDIKLNGPKVKEKLAKLQGLSFLDNNLKSNTPELEEENEDNYDEDYSGSESKPTCMFCHATFFSLEAVKDHVKLLHGDSQSNLNLGLTPRKTISENSEGTNSQSKIKREKSKETVPRKKLYKCNFCGIRKVSYQLIQIHRNIHKRQIALQCKFCGSKLRRLASFKIHRVKCRRIGSAFKKCKYCSFKFFYVSDLKKHVKNVHLTKIKNKLSNISKLSLSKMSGTGSAKRWKYVEDGKVQLRSQKPPKKRKSHQKSVKCDSCDLYFSEMTHLIDHKIRHKIQQCLKFGICIWCSKLFGDKSLVSIHTEMSHEEWLARKSCSLCCDKEFLSKREFKLHFLKKHFPEKTQLVMNQMLEYKNDSKGNEAFSKVIKELHDITGEGSDVEEPDTFRPTYFCPLCDFQTEDESAIKNHQITHKNNYCNVCQNLFKSRIFCMHANYHSRDSLGEKCSLCNALFHDDIHLLHHLQIDHPDYKNKCNMCTDSFITLTDLVKHKCAKHGENLQKVITCKICQIKFLSKKLFRNHKEFAHRPSPSCKFCDKAFPSIKRLLLHEKKHLTQVKIYKCSTCGKVLKTISGLKAHKEKHIGVKLQSCGTCGKRFKTTFFMREHLASHSEDHQKRYHCTICGRGFYFYDTHCRHRKVHLDPFLYSCRYCKKRFQNNTMLKAHNQTCIEEPKRKMTLRKSIVELDDSPIEDHDPTLHCEHCSFHTKYEKELNQHVHCHFVAPRSSDSTKAVSSLNERNDNAKKLTGSKIDKNKKKPKVLFQCSLCKAVCRNELDIKSHAKTVHGNSSVVISDSEEDKELETSEQVDDELIDSSCRGDEIPPGSHEDIYFDNWKDDEIILNKQNCKIDEECSESNESLKNQAKFSDSGQLTDVNETIVEENKNLPRPSCMCMFCYATFSSFEAVEDHIKLLHDNTNDSRLKSSGQKLAKFIMAGGERHVTTVKNTSYTNGHKFSKQKLFKCNFCGIRKVSFGFIKKHTNAHKRKLSLQCKLCGSKFKRISRMKVHQFKCRKVASAARRCILCGFMFFSNFALKTHFMNVHLAKWAMSTKVSGSTNKRNRTLASLNNAHGNFGRNSLDESTHNLNRYNLKGQQQNFQCSDCGEVFTVKGRLVYHKAKHRIQQCLDYNICICCNKIFVNRVHLDIHTENVHPEWFSGKVCPLCERVFCNNNSLKHHYLRYHTNDELCYDLVKQITDYQNSLNENKGCAEGLQGFVGEVSDFNKHVSGYNPLLVYRCPIVSCMFQSKDHVLIEEHAKKHDQNYCRICESLFNNAVFNYHIKYHSQTFLQKQCALCKGFFHDSIHLMYHKQSVHQDLKHECNMCCESFLTPENLAQHKNNIHQKTFAQILKCSGCQMKFHSRKALRNHKESSHSLNCKHCDKSFNSLNKLIGHVKIHRQQVKRMIKCSACGKVCKSKDALKLHEKNHEDSLNPQRCETCLMRFESFYELKEHVASHLDDQVKKYFCDVCEKSFYFYDSHWRHRREHSERKEHSTS